MNVGAGTPILLFGAFDRHNLGDLLFPHIAAALLPGRELIHAGLAERDLRRFGGHRVASLARLAAAWGNRPVELVHVGGELLTCTAWQAAVMLQSPDEAQAIIARLEAHPDEQRDWVRRTLGLAARAPYTAASHTLFPAATRVAFNAVGGVALADADPALKAEVLARLRAADAVGVRDRQTRATLQGAGIDARLMPDPAVMVAELFGARIRRRARQGEVAQIRRAFPQGYVAVQFSAEFGDDATLAVIATQLDRVATSTGLGIALFRAGAAPWHDDASCFERVMSPMRPNAVTFCTSLNLWDLCALIAGSRACASSSLHGRIVATAFARPRVNLRVPHQNAGQTSKHEAWAATWEAPGLPTVVDVEGLAEGVRQALDANPDTLRQTAGDLAARYREAFRWISGPA